MSICLCLCTCLYQCVCVSAKEECIFVCYFCVFNVLKECVFLHVYIFISLFAFLISVSFVSLYVYDINLLMCNNFFFSLGTSFTVQWNNVLLKDHKDAGTFTFQVRFYIKQV